MLDATRDPAFMIAANKRFPDLAVEIRILAAAFHYPAPTRVPNQIDHGRKRNVYAVALGFLGRRQCAIFDQSHIERASKTERNRENRAVPVNDVEHKGQRIVVAAFSQPLTNFAHRGRAPRVKRCAHTPKRFPPNCPELAHSRNNRFFVGYQLLRRILRQLQRFFFQRHRGNFLL